MRLVKILMALTLFCLSQGIYAEVPHQISFQGILRDSTGNPVQDSVYTVKFRIYEDSISGNMLWETPIYVPVQTSNGLFQHNLGLRNPIPDSISLFPNLWIGITVNPEAELTPRTKLVSVPFSISAQYADTATASRDKTVNAGDLIAGTLDTARFSAYQDLESENRIGPGADQVAAGNHTHPGLDQSGVIKRIEDTTTVEVEATTYGSYIGKTIQIPPNTINDFFRVIFSFSLADGCTALNIGVQADGVPLVAKTYFTNTMDVWDVVSIKHSGQTWFARFDNFSGTPNQDMYYVAPVDIIPSDGMLIEITIWNDTYTPCSATVGTLIIEYDVD